MCLVVVCMYVCMYVCTCVCIEMGREVGRESTVVLPSLCGILPPPRTPWGIFTHSDVRLGSSGSRWKGKQQGRRGVDLEGMPGRKAALGIGFYVKLMGENLAVEVKSFGRFREIEGA